jgi:3-hydroxyacyl-[acyl-carrier-protein] dehydratase
MPLNDLFHIQNFQATRNLISAEIVLNPGHSVFSGHFPGHPVLPGVCMIHIAKELLEKAVQSRQSLIRADQIKFLTVIDPRLTPGFEVKLNFEWVDEDSWKASGSFFNGETVYFKLQGAMFGGVSRKDAK